MHPVEEFRPWLEATTREQYLALLNLPENADREIIRKAIDTRISKVREFYVHETWGPLARPIVDSLGKARKLLVETPKVSPAAKPPAENNTPVVPSVPPTTPGTENNTPKFPIIDTQKPQPKRPVRPRFPIRNWAIGGATLAALLLLIYIVWPLSKSETEGPIEKEPVPPGPVKVEPDQFVGNEPGELRTFALPNGEQIKLHWCPPGSFKRGLGTSQVRITLSDGFWTSETEVTQGQWQALMETSPWSGQATVTENPRVAATFISHGKGDDGIIEPESATEFCRRLTEQQRAGGGLPANWQCVLPTEPQWEYACRAGTSSRYCYGNDDPTLPEYAWYGSPATGAAPSESFAREVGLKQANAWGLHDVHGNVQEWCNDLLDPLTIPWDAHRVLRGGAWGWPQVDVNSSSRLPAITRLNDTGFRIVCVPQSISAVTTALSPEEVVRPPLKMEVFTGKSFSEKLFEDFVYTVDSDKWPNNRPFGEFRGGPYSVRWTGELAVPMPGKYEFTIISDDGMRVSLDDIEVVNDFHDFGHVTRAAVATIELEQRTYHLNVDFWEAWIGIANSLLLWKKPGDEVATIVPPSAFLPPPSVPSPLMDSQPSDAGWVNLLAWSEWVDWTARGHDWNAHVEGFASRNGLTLKSFPGNFYPLSANIDGDYDLEVEWTRHSGNETVFICFPISDRTLQLALHAVAGQFTGVETIDGKLCFDPTNPTVSSPAVLVNGERHRTKIHVRRKDGNVKFSIDQDAVDDFITWEGPINSLGGCRPLIGHPWLGAWDSRTTFHSAKIRMVSGKIRRDVYTDVDRQRDLRQGFVRLVAQRPIETRVGFGEFNVNIGFDADRGVPRIRRNFQFCDDYFAAHAPSQIVWAVPPGSKSFSVVGLNQVSRTTVFKVAVDGVSVYDSGITGKAVFKVDLPEDAEQVELIVDPVGNNWFDQSYWCYPRFHKVSADKITDEMLTLPPSDVPSSSATAGDLQLRLERAIQDSLNNVQPLTASAGVKHNQTDWAPPIHFRDAEVCDEFLCAHAVSYVVYEIPHGMTRFTAIGYAIESNSVEFEVVADSTSLFKSGRAGIVPIDVAIPAGAKFIVLKADPMGDGRSDHSYWCYPRLYRETPAAAKRASSASNSLIDSPTVLPTGRKAGDTRELTLAGGQKLVQVWCPKTTGSFKMGSTTAQIDALLKSNSLLKREYFENETPQVDVTLTQGFWLGQTEVTQGQWQAVMGTTPWLAFGDTDYYKVGANYPAVYISHIEAEGYCAKLTEIEQQAGRLPTGSKYALPTESQWEYACRAGTSTAYSFGDDASMLGEYAWFEENADDVNQDYAHIVGQKKSNPWGLFDMHGNVWEWCRDGYVDKLPGGSDPVANKDVESIVRVLRGGSWNNRASLTHSANRNRGTPNSRSSVYGFRVAMTP